MVKLRSWSDDQFTRAVSDSISIAQVLEKLGLRPSGGNYISVKRHIERLGLDKSHFKGQSHLGGKTHDWAKKRPLSEILVKGSTYSSTQSLRLRLIKEGVLENKCYNPDCPIEGPEWLGKPMTIQLDHINGVRDDNRIENLRLLCPNCHSQTDTYCGKNIGRV